MTRGLFSVRRYQKETELLRFHENFDFYQETKLSDLLMFKVSRKKTMPL